MIAWLSLHPEWFPFISALGLCALVCVGISEVIYYITAHRRAQAYQIGFFIFCTLFVLFVVNLAFWSFLSFSVAHLAAML